MNNNISIKSNTTGDILGIVGGNYRVIISGEETNGNYAVIEMLVPDGGGPPPHAHPAMQEMFYVLQGTFEFKTEAGHQLLEAGGFVNIPLGGDIHCFKNVSGKPGSLLCTVVPAGLENYFKEAGQLVQPGQFLPMPEMTAERIAFMQDLDKRYGIKTYPRDFL